MERLVMNKLVEWKKKEQKTTYFEWCKTGWKNMVVEGIWKVAL